MAPTKVTKQQLEKNEAANMPHVIFSTASSRIVTRTRKAEGGIPFASKKKDEEEIPFTNRYAPKGKRNAKTTSGLENLGMHNMLLFWKCRRVWRAQRNYYFLNLSQLTIFLFKSHKKNASENQNIFPTLKISSNTLDCLLNC